MHRLGFAGYLKDRISGRKSSVSGYRIFFINSNFLPINTCSQTHILGNKKLHICVFSTRKFMARLFRPSCIFAGIFFYNWISRWISDYPAQPNIRCILNLKWYLFSGGGHQPENLGGVPRAGADGSLAVPGGLLHLLAVPGHTAGRGPGHHHARRSGCTVELYDTTILHKCPIHLQISITETINVVFDSFQLIIFFPGNVVDSYSEYPLK